MSAPPSPSRKDGSLRAFVRAIRGTSGFGLRLLATLFFALSLATTKGVKTALEALALGVLVLVGIGYPLFRKRGRLP